MSNTNKWILLFSTFINLLSLMTISGAELDPSLIRFYSVKAITDDKILPDTPLPDSLLAKSINMTACRKEFESASFVIIPNLNVDLIDITCLGLVQTGGYDTIPAENIDFRYVKCWYQAHQTLSVENGKSPLLTPELLLKNDNMVYTRNNSNYLMINGTEYDISNEDGVFREDGTYVGSIGSYTDGNGVLHYYYIPPSNSEFPVQDASTLQSASFAMGENKQMWLTVKVPENISAGIYKGEFQLNFQVKSSTSTIHKKIKLTVNVPDFELLDANLKYSIFYESALADEGEISSEVKDPVQFRAEMKNLYEHGVKLVPMQGQHDRLFRDALVIRREENIINSVLYYFGLNIMAGTDAGSTLAENLENLRQIVSDKRDYVRQFGITDFYIFGIDEVDLDTPEYRSRIDVVQQEDVKVFSSRPGDVADILDLGITCPSFPNPTTPQDYVDNNNECFVYAEPQGGKEVPETFRRNYGLKLWKNGYLGAMTFAYQYSFWNTWNDFDSDIYRDHNFVYPTVNGVIDTLAWEGFREAVDDNRYYNTLLNAIEEAENSSNITLEEIAHTAKAWLAGLEDNVDLEQMRTKMISFILQLKQVPYDNLCAKWEFEDGTGSTIVSDSSNNNNTCSLVNMDAGQAWVKGLSSKGLHFNATSEQYLNCGNSSSLNPREEITFMAWVRPTISEAGVIYSSGLTSGQFSITVNPAINVWARTEDNGWHRIANGLTHDWNGWNHIAWTYNSNLGVSKLYFNGIEEFSSTNSTGKLSHEDILFVKLAYAGNYKYFDGDMDDVRIYSKALTDDEIKRVYRGSTFCGYWKFDEATGNIAGDCSGRANTATACNIDDSNWVVEKDKYLTLKKYLTLNAGSQQYLYCGNDDSLNPEEQFSVMAWVKPVSQDSQIVYSSGLAGQKFRMNVMDKISVIARVNGVWGKIGEGPSHDWSEWNHVTWTYNSITGKHIFYFNGVLDWQSDDNNPIFLDESALSAFRIGGYENYKYYDGQIDEVKFFNRALTQGQVIEEMNDRNAP